MKIAIAGTGYVGLVTGVCLAHMSNHEIVCLDVDSSKVEMLNSSKSPIYEEGLEELLKLTKEKGNIKYTSDFMEAYSDADAIFIAVGTPERSDGSANLDYIKKVLDEITKSISNDVLVIVKSTVPIGTNSYVEYYLREKITKDIRVEVASNPEFLAQGTAVRDTLQAQRIVIGVESKWAEEKMLEIYRDFDIPKLITNRNSAEMVKYASNDFLALKISYMNDIANLCEVVGANVEDVALGMSYDERIGKNFLKPGIGYGGSCFPKDTKALHWLSTTNGYELKTIKAAIEVNEIQKLKLVKKASSIIDSFEDMKIAVLGLTYKPGTDDLREAPSIVNIEYLLERNGNIHVYDPVGIENAKKIFGEKIVYENSIEGTIKDADMCFIMTEWKEIVEFDLEKYVKLMKRPLVFDGRNCYKLKTMEENGVEYYSIGR